MKTLKLIALVVLAITLSQCKTTAPTQPQSSSLSVIEVARVLDTTAKQFLQFADQTNGDPRKALMLTATWIKSQPAIKDAQARDSGYIDILLNSGLQTTFSIDLIDPTGLSLFKGGGSEITTPPLEVSSTGSSNTISNKKVLLYLAGFSQFYTAGQIQKIVDYFTNSGLGLDVTVLKDEQCTYQTVESFKDYGLVIIDTHGGPDVFLTGSSFSIYPDATITEEQVRAIIIKQLGQDCLDKLLSGALRIGKAIRINLSTPLWPKKIDIGRTTQILTTTDYITSLHSMPGTVVFGNMCYSGQSSPVFNSNTPMKTAFMGLNPISYYGYAFSDGTSGSVNVPFSNAMFDTLVHALVVDGDSTGIANLQTDHTTEYVDPLIFGNALLFKHFGADDYSYQGCIDTFTDARDQHFYHAVCIGKQKWMVENLAFNAQGSRVYEDDPSNAAIYGRLYDWNTLMQGAASSSTSPSKVKGICPNGWHLPSELEWKQAIATLGGGDVAANAMESDNLWLTPSTPGSNINSSGFSVLPSGFLTAIDPSSVHADQIWWNKGESSGYWATTESNATDAINFQFTRNIPFHPVLTQSAFGKSAALPCRCLKD
jgi:uncharacterized protein (TIGR02145 family)